MKEKKQLLGSATVAFAILCRVSCIHVTLSVHDVQ